MANVVKSMSQRKDPSMEVFCALLEMLGKQIESSVLAEDCLILVKSGSETMWVTACNCAILPNTQSELELIEQPSAFCLKSQFKDECIKGLLILGVPKRVSCMPFSTGLN